MSKKTHGMTKTPLYVVWKSMRKRCNCATCQDYKNYGGRGIKICDEWNDFINFYSWAVNNGYQKGLSIDRIDVNGNYEPSNCRWADSKTQGRNKRDTIFMAYEGQVLPLQTVVELSGIKRTTLARRLKSGWSDYDASHISPSKKVIRVKAKHSHKISVHITSLTTGKHLNFESCKEASLFLGKYGDYLSRRFSRNKESEFYIGDYYVELEKHYHQV